LTEIRFALYSGGMISDFHYLSEKISQLAELARSLRQENADLRLTVTALTAESADLSKRMQEAYQRVATLLEQMPSEQADEEAA
jgi:cell division protein ZapB